MAVDWNIEGFYKHLKASKLKELLAQIPDDYEVTADNLGATQDLNVYTPEGEHYATIDMGHEHIQLWQTEE